MIEKPSLPSILTTLFRKWLRPPFAEITPNDPRVRILVATAIKRHQETNPIPGVIKRKYLVWSSCKALKNLALTENTINKISQQLDSQLRPK